MNYVTKHWLFYEKKVEKIAFCYGGNWVVELGNVLLGIISKAGAERAPWVPIHKCGHKLLLKGLDLSSPKQPNELQHTQGGTKQIGDQGPESPTLQQTGASAAWNKVDNALLYKMWVIAQVDAFKNLKKYMDHLSTVFLWQSSHASSDPKFFAVVASLRLLDSLWPCLFFSFRDVTVCILRCLKKNFPFYSAFCTVFRPFLTA